MTEYRGRFAPSPTGPLHMGSLLAATISYLDCKANQGRWMVRIEDIDPPREQPGATTSILNCLEKHGFEWDEPVVYQSQQTQRYQSALAKLQQQNRLFWCNCSRKQLANEPVYPGFCRHKTTLKPDHACRFLVQTQEDSFNDLFQGDVSAQPITQFGDVVLQRRDGLFAYQLAVVCDDIAQGITHVIRGIDLMDSTFWQRELYRVFDITPPVYGHFPVIVDSANQQKLSKQNGATAVNNHNPSANLSVVLRLLGLPTEEAEPTLMLRKAVGEWRRNRLVNITKLETSDHPFTQSLKKPTID